MQRIQAPVSFASFEGSGRNFLESSMELKTPLSGEVCNFVRLPKSGRVEISGDRIHRLSNYRPKQARQTDNGNCDEEIRPEVERTVQMLAESEAGVWQRTHGGHPNRKNSLCKIPTSCKTHLMSITAGFQRQ
jgi:hypothetical protein